MLNGNNQLLLLKVVSALTVLLIAVFSAEGNFSIEEKIILLITAIANLIVSMTAKIPAPVIEKEKEENDV